MSDRRADQDGDDDVDDERLRPSTAMKAAALIVVLESVALIAAGVAEIFAIDSSRLALGVTNVVFFLVYGGLLLVCARALVAAHSWSRSPIVLTQLIQLGVAWSFAGGSTTWVSVVLAVAAAGVLAVMLAPSTTLALYGRRSRWDVGESAERE